MLHVDNVHLLMHSKSWASHVYTKTCVIRCLPSSVCSGVPSGRTSQLLSSVSCPMDAKHLYNNCTLGYHLTHYCSSEKVAISCRGKSLTSLPTFVFSSYYSKIAK